MSNCSNNTQHIDRVTRSQKQLDRIIASWKKLYDRVSVTSVIVFSSYTFTEAEANTLIQAVQIKI